MARRPVVALALGLLTGLLGVGAAALRPVLELEENVGLQALFALRGPVPVPDDVVVVGIDRDAAEALGLPLDLTQWPRSVHAELLDRLVAAGVSTVAFDIMFERQREPMQDERLARAIDESRSVILLDRMQRRITPLEGSGNQPSVQEITRRLRPLPKFTAGAVATAPFPLPVVPIRTSQFWTFLPFAFDAPTLPVAALQLHLLGALEQLRARLIELRPELSERLPPCVDTEPLRKADVFERTMRELRAVFLAEPDLVGTMRERIEDESSDILDGELRRQLLALLLAYGGPSSRYLNYYGPPQSIRTVPYHEALANFERDPKDWAGKAVFIGFSERTQPDQQDTFYSVFSERSGLNLSGVEIAATAFANLLESRPVTPLTMGQSLLTVFVWGTLLGTGLALASTGIAVTMGLTAAMAYTGLAVQQFGSAGTWWPLVVPLLLQLPAGLFGAAWWNYARAHGRSRRLGRATRLYLPDSVVRRMEDEPGPLADGYELVDGICLVTDAEQYTALSESMRPEDLAGVLNQYYEVLFEIVQRNGGQVTDVVGDSMVAVWTSKGAPDDARSAACRAALEVVSAQQTRRGRIDVALPTRVGLHGGEFLLGTIGAAQHLEYRAVGDTVNSASRMQGLNKQLGTRILVSAQALATGGEWASRELGTFMLAGKQAALTVYELLGAPDSATTSSLAIVESFATALASYRAGRLSAALEQFREIVARYPDDGPSRFYRALCERALARSPGEPWDPVVRLPDK